MLEGVDPKSYRKAKAYHEYIVKLKVFTHLRMIMVRGQSMRKITRPRIKSNHPLYLVASLKKEYGSVREYVRISAQ